MNIGDIAERLIQAAEIEDRLPHVGPVRLRAQQLPYVHTDEDMRGWGKRPGEKDRLRREDADRHATHRREFWERVSVTARDVSDAEEAVGWYSLVEDEENRAALAAWARCMADHKRLFFKDWCLEQSIHPETGRRRKNAALTRIYAHLSRCDVQNSDNGQIGVLPDTPENGDIADEIASRVKETDGIISWLADDAFQPFLFARMPGTREIETPGSFDWAAKRNERRRQREKRRKEAA